MIGSGISGLDNSGLGGMKGKGRETIDANGQIIREVATRRGDDLGIGLGDFDMLDTLGSFLSFFPTFPTLVFTY